MGEEPHAADALEQRLDEVIALYLASEDAGEAPAAQDWIDRHPDLAPQLREFFASHQQVGRWAGRTSALAPRAGSPEATRPQDGARPGDLSSTVGDECLPQ